MLMKKIFNCLLITILLTSVGLAALGSRAHASYNPSFLISDTVFTNNGSMSQADIQNFLITKNSGLSGYKDTEDCGSTSGPHYSYYATYYSCGQYVQASKIIYDAAQAYQISPRVILATLQKEESLITTPNPTQSQLNCAMGYNSCGGYVGFFSQIDNGTWQFKTYYELMNGRNWWGYAPSHYPCKNASSLYSAGLLQNNTVTFYNPGGSARTIVIANSSTAALYCYTPYVGPYSETGYSGSYNFVFWFEQWWSSTIDNCITSPLSTQVPGPHTPTNGDYNGDGRTDVGIYRPSDGCWHVRGIGDVGFGGVAGDIPAPGDYNGDGKTDVAIYRPGEGGWHIRNVGDYAYGASGDVPVPADYNGDGHSDIAVYRPNNGTWHVRAIGDYGYGQSGDVPVPGDYNGDGKTDVAVFRPSDGTWHVRAIGDYGYGQSGDVPLVGDFNYDGRTEIAVYRPSDGSWHVRAIGDYGYGASTDLPITKTLNAMLLMQYGLISNF